MNPRVFAVFGALAGVSLLIGPGASQAQPASPGTVQKEKGVTTRATGTFEVKLTPQGTGDDAEGSKLGRMSLDKQFRGDLEAASKGEMLTALTSVQGSAGYVAIERVTGTLAGGGRRLLG